MVGATGRYLNSVSRRAHQGSCGFFIVFEVVLFFYSFLSPPTPGTPNVAEVAQAGCP